MAKKIRFPLNLSDGTQVRSLEELKEHFDLEAVLGHYKSGKLLTWLRDRYIETEADAVEALDEGVPDFQQKLCAIFGVEFSGSGVDMEEITRRQERMKKLREYTDEDEFIQNIDAVAFDPEELIDLLDEGCEKIYLCGEKFAVPASQRGRAYIGVNSPKVKISGNVGDDWAEHGITFTGCEVENLPHKESSALPLIAKDEITSLYKHVQVKIEDIFPIFESVLPHLDLFAKVWILNKDSSDILSSQSLMKMRMTNVDRYMLMRERGMYVGLWNDRYLNVTLTGAIPDGIYGDSRIIAKKILGSYLTCQEEERLAEMLKIFSVERKKMLLSLRKKEMTMQPLSKPEVKPVRITINSKYTHEDLFGPPKSKFGMLNRIAFGDSADAFDKLLYFGNNRAQATKNIEDVYPVFSSVFQEADVFAKLWIANQTLDEDLYYRTVDELRMKDSDKFMVMQMNSQYDGLWNLNDLNIVLIDGIPEGIHNDSYIIAKEILHKPLTESEQERLTQICNMFTDADKDIDDRFPVFRTIYQDLDVFAKLWLHNETSQEGLWYTEVAELHMKDSDKFMIMRMHCQYNSLWKEKKLNVTLNNGIPNGIHGDSLLIAKRIIGNRLTNIEQQRINEMISNFKSKRIEFFFH